MLVQALVGALAADFQSAMYPVLTAGGTGRERLEQGLGALCDLVERHLPLMLANDEAFHQHTAPGRPPDYLHPFIRFLRDGAADGSSRRSQRRRGRRRYRVQRDRVAVRPPARPPRLARARARALVTSLVLDGVDAAEPPLEPARRISKRRKEQP